MLLRSLQSPFLANTIVGLACELLGAYSSSLVTFGPDDAIVDVATTGITYERRAVGGPAVRSGILRPAFRERTPVRATLDDEPCLAGLPRDHGPVHLLAVALGGAGLAGALWVVRNADAPPFTPDDEMLLSCFAGQCGLALENATLHGQLRGQEPAFTAVREASYAVLQGKATDDILQLVARSARELVGAQLVTVATPGRGESAVVRIADGAQADSVLGRSLSASGSIAVEVMRTGRPQLVDDASSDERCQQVFGVEDLGSAMFVPIAVDSRVFGTFGVMKGVANRGFTSDDVLLIQTLAAEAAMALDVGQMRAELDRLALLEERERIAMELHDGVVQALFVVGLSLQAAEDVADDPAEIRGRLNNAVDSIDRAIRDLRNYIFGLRPSDLGDRHLERALRELAETMERSGRVSTSLELDPRAASKLSTRSATIIQAAREAMSNAVHHSAGDKVALRFVSLGSEVLLEVVDNGIGFDPADVRPGGNGMGNLRARATELGGTLEIESVLPSGSCVRIRVPV